MRHLIKKFKFITTIFVACVMILTGCSTSSLIGFMKNPTKEELLESIPKMDISAYNRFMFTMDILAGNADGNGKKYALDGAVELYDDISHIYNLNVCFDDSEHKISAETWADFGTDRRYTDIGNGWYNDIIVNSNVINDLADAINIRDTEMDLDMTESACTLSWTFTTDDDYLFGDLMKHYTDDMNLDGYGRITAVFDPQTYKFLYFTFVISTGNSEKASAVLDAVFYWDVKNSKKDALQIPDDAACTAYETATGVSTNGGYDSVINPMAETFISVYGGTARVNHHEHGSTMFWTMKNESVSATVNYERTEDPKTIYDNHHDFMMSFYEESAEDTDNGAYFYDSESGELTYMAAGNDWYAEIIITAESGTSQGSLRKSLITYKARLGI